jgi:hypothetical protein
VSRDLLFYAVGLTGSALLAAAVPFGGLQHSMKHSDPASPLLMAGIAVPMYSTPLPGMMKVGLMFEHGNSLGAAFVLFTLGIGTSCGTLLWLGVDFGWRRVVPWVLAYAAVILAMAYPAEPLLYDTRKAEADHTHAFDDYSNPFPAGQSNLPHLVRVKLAEKFGPLERPAVYALVGLAAVGLAVRRLDRLGRPEGWLTARPAEPGWDRPTWDVTVPAPVLGGVALAGLIAFSVIGAYVYYPDRDQCRDQMAAINADAAIAVRTGRAEEAIRHLEQWDLVARKLEVGEYLRTFRVVPGQAKAADDLREALEDVRDKLLAKEPEEAWRTFEGEVKPAYDRCKAVFPRGGP